MAINSRDYDAALDLLKEHGATLSRTKKHKVWKMPDGRSWTMPASPSDVHSWKNNLSDLRNFLGVNGERGKPGVRRPKKAKKRQHKPVAPVTLLAAQPPRRSQMDELLALRESLAPVKPEPPIEIAQLIPQVIEQPVIESHIRVWWKPWTWLRKVVE